MFSRTGIITIAFILISGCSIAQDDFLRSDSIRTLNEIVVHAYSSDRPLSEVPASIGIVEMKNFEGLSNASLLSVVNTMPGVRMEERSPGSYRFAIRGSSLRSPFGVRNVKVYWNGLPFTDGGGNTYLNLLDFNSIGNVEVIKGPSGSLYGAGTGGVVLLNGETKAKELQLTMLAGSYGLQRYQFSGEVLSSEKIEINTQVAYQKVDGYREQTSMERLSASINAVAKLTKTSTLSTNLLGTGLLYETPGALTYAQFETDPRQARPATKSQPGAVEQKASVKNNTAYLGIRYENEWNEKWSTQLGLYGALTDFRNPAIRNFEKRKESNWGGRLNAHYNFSKKSIKGKLTFGGEYQQFFSPIYTYDNLQGEAGNLQYHDDIQANQGLLFIQAEIILPKDFFVTVGGSDGFVKYDIIRKSDAIPTSVQTSFDPVFSPRVAVLKKILPELSLFTSVSEGYSPPTVAEFRPSNGDINPSLIAERGINYEGGVRGNLLKGALAFDFVVYKFQLKDAIVIRHAADGAEYFINSGKTSLQGLEASVSWSPILKQNKTVSAFKLWANLTLNQYQFKDYIQDTDDCSGNKVTGVAPTIAVGGLNITLRNKIYFNASVTYTDHIPLTDTNTEYAAYFILVGGRAGYKFNVNKRLPMEFFGGADNLLNANYSLGNDLNASGGRFYNAAAGRNFYIGLKTRFIKQR